MNQKFLISHNWWHGATIYHIYPRSFYDANGDGVGDLPGIIERLDYLKGKPDSLGVDAIWLSPFYTSPMADFGYDVADYCDVDPIFGDIKDFDKLIEEAHKRDLRVIVDFVPNHSSAQHPWFQESLQGKNSKKRDWYTWRDPREDGGPPTNWKSVFGGSAWEYHEPTGQYYLHSFLKEQPDLNWDNPEVREAMKDNMRFWLDKGIDGFRVDAVSWMSKDALFRDDPLNSHFRPGDDPYHEVIHSFSCAGPNLFKYLNELTSVCKEYDDIFMITEAYPDVGGEISHYLNFYEQLDSSMCAPFNFECISFPWDAQTYRGFIDLFQEALLPGQPPIYNMGNHDKSRLASRIGPEAARTAALLLLTLPGIAFIYYGDELGMTDVDIPPDRVRDPTATPNGLSRDPQRTPLQWDETKNAGFSTVHPWLPVDEFYKSNNIAAQRRDDKSLWTLYKQLLDLRKSEVTLKVGTYRSLNLHPNIFAFVREYSMDRLTVVLNFSDRTVDVQSKALKGRIIMSTHDVNHKQKLNGQLSLQPYEGLIISAGI